MKTSSSSSSWQEQALQGLSLSSSSSSSSSSHSSSLDPQAVHQVATLLHGLLQPDTLMIRQAEQQLKPWLKNPATMSILWHIIVTPHQHPTTTTTMTTTMTTTITTTSSPPPGQSWSGSADPAAQNRGLRQVAAILLRKRLPTHYSHLTTHTAAAVAADPAATPSTSPLDPAGRACQLAWQQQVLEALARETDRPVRQGLLGVAAALAQIEQQPTPPYLQFLAAATQETAPAARELTFLLLAEMTETVALHWKQDHLPALQQLFHQALRLAPSPSPPPPGGGNSTTTTNTSADHPPLEEAPVVQQAAVRALGQLLSFWADDEEEMAAMAFLLPSLLQVAARHVHEEDFMATVLDVLYDLAFSPAEALLPLIPTTVQFALQCLCQPNLAMRIRDAAALVIATTAEAKPKTLGRDQVLLGQILDALFQLMQDSPESAAGALFESNPAWKADLRTPHGGGADHLDVDDDDDDDGDDSPTETSMAQGTLDMLACEIPKKYIWKPCLQRCLDRMADPQQAGARKAGVAGLGVIAEGCHEPLTAALPQLLPLVLAAAQDPHPQVRECACFCLGQISEHCQPEILSYSQQLLPIVFGLLDDGSVAVQATSCYVLEMFCERLEPRAVRPLLDSLVRKLAHMLEITNKRSVQEMAVAALAATAVAAEEEFAPYVPGVAHLMTQLLLLSDPTLYSLRGRALECMGHMAIAVGRDLFRPYFTATMQCAVDGLSKDSTDLQEFAYAAFANLAKVMKEEFAPALPELVPHLCGVIEQDEGQWEVPGDDDDDDEDYVGDAGADPSQDHKDGSKGAGRGGQLAALDDSDDEDDEEGNHVLHIRTALLEVKKGAITALGEMAAHTGTSFCPFLEQCIQVLQKAVANWNPLVKAEAADALPSMIIPSIHAYHNGEIQWTKGDFSGAHPLSAHTAAVVEAVLKEELALLKDDDKLTVGKACEAIQTTIELCGPLALSLPDVAEQCLSLTHALLAKTAPCQATDGMYGEYPDDDDDHDHFIHAACDLVGAFGRVMGERFAPYLPQFLPVIIDYAKPSRPASDRSMAIGCLSEIAQELEVAIVDHWKSVFLPAILTALADEDDNVKRNGAFCAGICCEHLRERVTSDYPALLDRLGPLFAKNQAAAENENTAACVDNAAAAVARMIMASPSHVPLPAVLPAFLHVLPLKTDMTENETVYKCITGLLQMKQPDILAQVNELQRIVHEINQEGSKVNEEIRSKLQAALHSLNAQ